ncbi:hypothetical protein ACFSX5_15460 [Devosia albogilva]|uniref:Uncharacterized protein n=1 Tax=Devosia albogilva TaxID=429726 RepID=A0ABW5QNX9_9HYPH
MAKTKATSMSPTMPVCIISGCSRPFPPSGRNVAGPPRDPYLLLLLAAVEPNAGTILGYGWYAIVIAAAALCLNLAGYLVGWTARLFTNDREELIAFLFTVSKKEFSIAAAFVVASGLPSEVAVPAAFFAVI